MFFQILLDSFIFIKAFGNSVSWKHELLRGLRGQLGTSAPHSVTKPPVYSGLKYHFGTTQKLSCSFWRLLVVSGVLQKEKPELKEGDSHWLGSLGNHPAAWSQLRIYSEHLLDPAAKSTALCTPLFMFTFLMRQHGTSFLKENKATPPSKEKAKHCLYPTSSKKRKRTILLETNLHLLKPWAGVGWVRGLGVIQAMLKKSLDKRGPGISGKCGPHPRCGAMKRVWPRLRNSLESCF